MKFVFIGSRDVSLIGGIENYMVNLCSHLAKKGHDVVLYTEGQTFQKKNINGFTVITVPSVKNKFFNKILIGFISTIHSLIFQKQVDIFHYNAFGAGLSSIFTKLAQKSVVYQGHGFEWQRAKWGKLSRSFIKYLDNLVLRFNSNIVMVSENQSEYVRKNFKKHAKTITPAIELPKPVAEKKVKNVLQKYNLKKNEYFLYLGRLVQEKKADVLINAFIYSNISNKKLVIAGDDPYEKKYIGSLKELAKSKKEDIIFTGAVYGDDKEVLLSECFVYCIPSELEGLPITLLEAMSYRKVCIASDIPACKEALGDEGLFFRVNDVDDLKDKLVELNNEPHLFSELGKYNYQRVKANFTWDKIADQYINYCSGVLNRK